jgi:hypothetical protein
MITYKEFLLEVGLNSAYTGSEETPDESKLVKKSFATTHQKATVDSYKKFDKNLSYIGHDHRDHAIISDKKGNYIRVNRYGEPLVHSKD